MSESLKENVVYVWQRFKQAAIVYALAGFILAAIIFGAAL